MFYKYLIDYSVSDRLPMLHVCNHRAISSLFFGGNYCEIFTSEIVGDEKESLIQLLMKIEYAILNNGLGFVGDKEKPRKMIGIDFKKTNPEDITVCWLRYPKINVETKSWVAECTIIKNER